MLLIENRNHAATIRARNPMANYMQ